MPLEFRCRCGEVVTLPDDASGRKMSCPRCLGTITVPDGRSAATLPSEAPSPHIHTAIPVPQESIPEVADVEVLHDDEDDATPYDLSLEAPTAGEQEQSSADLGAIRVRGDAVRLLVYGADRATGLAAEEDMLHFLDLKARQSMPLRRMHTHRITCLAVSADGRLGLSGDEDGGLLLWDLQRRRPREWLDGHRGSVLSVAFAANGTLAASGGEGGAVRLWKMPDGQRLAHERAQLEQHVNCLCFSPDSLLLVAIGDEGRMRLWSMTAPQRVGKLQKGPEGMRAAVFSKDGRSILACKGRGFRVCKWDVNSGERQTCFAGFSKRQPRVLWTWLTPDGASVVAIKYTIDVAPRMRDDDPDAGMDALFTGGLIGGLGWAASKLGENLADAAAPTVRGDLYLERWDVTGEAVVSSLNIGMDDPRALACSPDGRRALVAFDEGKLQVYGL